MIKWSEVLKFENKRLLCNLLCFSVLNYPLAGGCSVQGCASTASFDLRIDSHRVYRMYRMYLCTYLRND